MPKAQTQPIESSPDWIHAAENLRLWRDTHQEPDNEESLEFPTAADAIEFTAQQLLLSQRLLVFSEALDTCVLSGIGTGKTVALLTRAVLQSYAIPNNYGLVARDTEANLITTTRKDFEDLFGGLIVEQNKSEGIVKIQACDGRLSTIAFRYLRSSRPGMTHLSNLNLGFYAVDQLEDIEKSEYDYLNTRLRRRVVRRSRWSIANTKGKDWLYRRYVEPAIKRKKTRTRMVPGKLGKLVAVEEWWASKDLYAIRSPTEENNHLPDGFIEDILANRAQEYIDRYLHGSFEEWGGRIYKAYSYDSVHNLDAFPIPDDWPVFVWIDVGGDSPWAVIVARQNHHGDVFVTNELYGPDLLPHQIISWLKNPENGVPAGKTPRVIIDPQNKLAVTEFFRYGLMVEAARKGPKVPGIMHVADYFRGKESRVRMIPQPAAGGGFENREFQNAPHLWVFKRCEHWRQEHDGWQWHRDPRTGLATNRPLDRDDHTCFVAGTWIDTERSGAGATPIQDLQVGDYVETPEGSRLVVGLMSRPADVVELALSDGRRLRCTPDHPFFTAEGWVSAEHMVGRVAAGRGLIWKILWRLQQRIANQATQSLSSEGAAITSAESTGKSQATAPDSTETSGKKNTGRSRVGFTSTTLTVIKPIARLRISNFCWLVTTSLAICRAAIESRSLHSPSWLTPSLRLLSGARNTRRQLGLSLQKLLPPLPSPLPQMSPNTTAFSAASTSQARPLSAREPRRRSSTAPSVATTARWLTAGRVARTISSSLALFAARVFARIAISLPGRVHVVAVTNCGSAAVYNLTVNEAHCYYANGILVSNCDATIYGLRILPPVQQLPKVDKEMERMRKHDPLSYGEAKAIAKSRDREPDKGSNLSELWSDDVDYDSVKKNLMGDDNRW